MAWNSLSEEPGLPSRNIIALNGMYAPDRTLDALALHKRAANAALSMLPLEPALQMVLQCAPQLPVENVPLAECVTRILGESVIAEHDFPRFDRSPLDGFAVTAEEVETATPDNPVLLRQIAAVYAGDASHLSVGRGTAIRIMTGAPMPSGASGVVRLEDTRTEGEQVVILDGKGAGANISRRAEDIRKGDSLLTRGTPVTAGVISVLAAMGRQHVHVCKRPKVAVIAIGSELLPPGVPLSEGKIYNSNTFLLSALAMEAGAEIKRTDIVTDNEQGLRDLLLEHSDCDLVLTSGGASVGDRDFTERVFRRVGIDLLFNRVNIKPGMPILAGRLNNTLVMGFSGNPAAAFIAFEMLCRPVILHMAGNTILHRKQVRAVLTKAYTKTTSSRRFVWAVASQHNGITRVEPLPQQGNGLLLASMRANALIVIPENSEPLAVGAEVEVRLI